MSVGSDFFQPALSGYNIYRGASSGNPTGEARAGLGAANLYGKLTGAGGINTGATGLLDALNIYQGLERGGWQGDLGAGASGLQLAGLLSQNPALSSVGGYLAAPLALYNFGENWRSGATGADTLSGAETGAEIGSILPGVGTLIGGAGGALVGALSSAFGPGAKDPETASVQNVINATSANQNNPNVAASVQDPYLQLAGLMDEHQSTLPEYQQYGRMGEQAFTNAMVGQINDAIKANPSLANNPTAVEQQVVDPWVNKMGSGYSNVGQTYTATNEGLLNDMVQQYLSGNAAQDWKAVGGDEPFANIYQGSPIQAAAQPQAAPEPMREYGNVSGRGMLQAKTGGTVKDSDLLSRLSNLRDIYKGSFKDRERHFGTGGYNAYVNYPSSNAPSYQNFAFNLPGASAPSSGTNSGGVPSDVASPDNSGGYGMGYYNNTPSGYTDTSPGGSSSGSSVLGQGGALSGLGSLLGVSSMGQLVQKYGALAPLLAGLLGQNKPASAPATPAGYGAIPSIATPQNNRSYTQPNVANWYTYGQGPEQSFFSNNQLPTVPGVSPASATQNAPNANTQPALQTPRAVMAGGGAFDSQQGDDYVPDPGHGDGTSDDVDAKLSGGEYVMDAGTVSMLGNGSNEAGARALDNLRHRVRKHAGKQLVKGKQFMKAKQPQAYLQGGKE